MYDPCISVLIEGVFIRTWVGLNRFAFVIRALLIGSPPDLMGGTTFLIFRTAGSLISTEGAPINEVLIRKRSER